MFREEEMLVEKSFKIPGKEYLYKSNILDVCVKVNKAINEAIDGSDVIVDFSSSLNTINVYFTKVSDIIRFIYSMDKDSEGVLSANVDVVCNGEIIKYSAETRGVVKSLIEFNRKMLFVDIVSIFGTINSYKIVSDGDYLCVSLDL